MKTHNSSLPLVALLAASVLCGNAFADTLPIKVVNPDDGSEIPLSDSFIDLVAALNGNTGIISGDFTLPGQLFFYGDASVSLRSDSTGTLRKITSAVSAEAGVFIADEGSGSLNLDLRDIEFSGGEVSDYGGAIYAIGELFLTSNNAVFSANKAQGYGGAIYANGRASFSGKNTFENNTAEFGGAILVRGDVVFSGDNSEANFSGNTGDGSPNDIFVSDGNAYFYGSGTYTFGGGIIVETRQKVLVIGRNEGGEIDGGTRVTFQSGAVNDIAGFLNIAGRGTVVRFENESNTISESLSVSAGAKVSFLSEPDVSLVSIEGDDSLLAAPFSELEWLDVLNDATYRQTSGRLVVTGTADFTGGELELVYDEGTGMSSLDLRAAATSVRGLDIDIVDTNGVELHDSAVAELVKDGTEFVLIEGRGDELSDFSPEYEDGFKIIFSEGNIVLVKGEHHVRSGSAGAASLLGYGSELSTEEAGAATGEIVAGAATAALRFARASAEQNLRFVQGGFPAGKKPASAASGGSAGTVLEQAATADGVPGGAPAVEGESLASYGWEVSAAYTGTRGDVSASGGLNGYDYDADGIWLGLKKDFGFGVGGISLEAGESKTSGFGSKSEAETMGAGAFFYVPVGEGGSYGFAQVGASFGDNDMKRNYDGQDFGGSYDSQTLFAQAEIGTRIDLTDWLSVNPYISALYADYEADGFSDGKNSYGHTTDDSFEVEPGVRLRSDFEVAGKSAYVSVGLAWVHAFDDDGGETRVAYDGNSATVRGNAGDDDFAKASLDAGLSLTDSWRVNAGYSYTAGGDLDESKFYLGAGYAF